MFAQQTGCASRHVGIMTGVVLVAAAFFPKLWGLLIGTPAPVTGVFIVIMFSPLVVEGMKMIVQEDPDYRTGLSIGAALLVGIGLQSGLTPPAVGCMDYRQHGFLGIGIYGLPHPAQGETGEEA